VSTKRHGCVIRYVHGAKKDGTLTVVKMALLADAGAYNDYTSVVLPRMSSSAPGPTGCPTFLSKCGCAHQQPGERGHAGVRTAPGGLRLRAADGRLADALGMDPWTCA